MNEKKIIQELNIIFKQRGWKLLPHNNRYDKSGYFMGLVVIIGSKIWIRREDINYIHLNRFSNKQLDDYVMEYLKPIFKKYKITYVEFFNNSTPNGITQIR